MFFEAVEIDPNGKRVGSSSVSVVLKDVWADSDCRWEGDILTSLYEDADANNKLLVRRYFLTRVCDGDVSINGEILDDIEHTLMRGLVIKKIHPTSSTNLPPESMFNLQGSTPMYRPPPRLSASDLRVASLVPAPHPNVKYLAKTHYRIVFEKKGTTIYCLNTLPKVMTVLAKTVSGAFKFATVHV